MEVLLEFASSRNPDIELLNEVAEATNHGELLFGGFEWDNEVTGSTSRVEIPFVIIDKIEELREIAQRIQKPVIFSMGGITDDRPKDHPTLTIYDYDIE